MLGAAACQYTDPTSYTRRSIQGAAAVAGCFSPPASVSRRLRPTHKLARRGRRETSDSVVFPGF